MRIVSTVATTTTDSLSRAQPTLPVAEIRKEREAKGLTREQLAVRAKCSVAMLGQIERGVIPRRGIVVSKVLHALQEAA